MKLVKVDPSVVKAAHHEKYGNFNILTDFIESGNECCEVVDFPQKNAMNCAASLLKSTKHFRLDQSVKVAYRGNRVFLLRVHN